ncbi:hydroxylysine kinase-like [Scyliorhinus canicula]|uniref:hydroxylysine kinase-like n=1 Tax=Scyliorhinus canicula TaxID=7830 RepID=UPI0018F4EB67|nr:hydroxylysine kinase-like [Scyliorhinus canicula]
MIDEAFMTLLLKRAFGLSGVITEREVRIQELRRNRITNGSPGRLIVKGGSTEFQHPTRESLQREDFLWKLSNTHMLDTYLHVMEEESHQQMVEQIIQQFKEKILPNLSKFRKTLNHGDFSHTNILVQSQELDISGILDFTDMNYGCSVCDVAISIMYLMLESSDPLSVGGHVLSGFESVTPLGPEERDAVFLLVLCRFSQSLVLAKYNILLYPENEEYLLTTARSGWKCLHQLWSLGKEAVEKIWYEAAKTHCA